MSSARLLVGDVFERLDDVPDGSVDLLLTSPPFLALRSYLPDGHPDKAKEIGSEATPAEFLDTLLELTAVWRRKLAPHGSIAVELGDTYAGSGGAGGDYGAEGIREGQGKFAGSATQGRRSRAQDEALGILTPRGRPGPEGRDKMAGWPLDKSLSMLPTLYPACLAYGRNLLTGQPSPAGMWRIRNLKPWIRSNPPVGALGDKERPATSYITVATLARDRWFDLDAVRTRPSQDPATYTGNGYTKGRPDGIPGNEAMAGNPAGAPPLDWWHHADAVIDAEIDRRARDAGKPNATIRGNAKRNAQKTDGWMRLGDLDGVLQGARGVHIRRALQAAGILTTHDALDVSPKGYAGAHYAVWPPELCRLLIDEMCPRHVCTTCGEPRRRITKNGLALDRQPELAAHIKEQREALGVTAAEINEWFGYKEIAKNWERTDPHGARIPNPDDWAVLKQRLDLSDEFDQVVLDRWPDYIPQGDAARQNAEAYAQGSQGQYGGAQSMRHGRATKVNESLGWSDCGHNTWRPGHILDPFAGSGTTLAVATGMGRDATGIDLDPRNADLCRERVGMFLKVDERPTEAAS